MTRRRTGRLTITAILVALALAVSPSAITPPKIAFTDTKLTNGLRLIVAEDHVAPVFSIAVIYNVGSRDERQGPHRLRAPVRAHDVQGLRERRARRALLHHLQQRRHDERHDEQGAHALLRDDAGQPARRGAVPRGRPHAVARDRQGQPRQPAERGAGRAPAAASTTSRYGRTFEAVDELAFDNRRLQALGDRIDGRSERGVGRGRRGVLQDLLRAEQRDHRGHRRRDDRGDARASRASTSSRFRRSRRRRRSTSPSRRSRASGGSRSTIRWRGCRGSTSATAFPRTSRPTATPIDVLSHGARRRPQLALLRDIVRQKQLAVNVGAFAPDSRGPRLLRIIATPTPGQAGRAISRRRSTRRSSGSRAARSPSWEIDKARNIARRQMVGEPRQLAVARDPAGGERADVRRPGPDQHATTSGSRKVTAADVQRVAKQYLTPRQPDASSSRSPAPPAPKGGAVMRAPDRRSCRWLAVARAGSRPPAPCARRISRRRRRASCKKGKVPVSREILKVKLPKAAEADLPNGAAPDGARGSPAAAGLVSDLHSRRGRLLRSRPIGRASRRSSRR